MPTFGRQSKANLETVDPILRQVLEEAIKHTDFTVIDGHRDMERQNQYYIEGTSKVRWPNSGHNTYPSRAADLVPYPRGFDNDDEQFYFMATHVLAAACELGVRLDWGGHWYNFKDLAHFELKD